MACSIKQRRALAKARAAKKKYHKGGRSKTHKGEKDFTTKKSSKVFHEKGHYVRKGRKPYHK